jgi:arginine deiminase
LSLQFHVGVEEGLDLPGAAGTAPRPFVGSEVGRLRSVLVHRPGDELLAVARDPRAALFAEAVDPEAAAAEHDVFTAVLHAQGAEVLLVEDLLADALADASCSWAAVGAPAVRGLLDRSPRAAARALIVGDAELGLEPLPNLMYMRDQSVWLDRGVAVGRMATPARARESRLLRAVYGADPMFATAPRWSDASHDSALEGGDVLALGSGRVVLAVTERTTRAGAERLVRALLAGEGADEVLVLRLPPVAGFHLDLAMTLVDTATLAIWAPLRRALRGVVHRRSSTGIATRAVDDVLRWACDAVIEIGDRDPPAHGRSWDRGINVLALAPGVVVAYEDNEQANDRLQRAGITVVPVPGRALGAGRGGPHCLACPLVRES